MTYLAFTTLSSFQCPSSVSARITASLAVRSACVGCYLAPLLYCIRSASKLDTRVSSIAAANLLVLTYFQASRMP